MTPNLREVIDSDKIDQFIAYNDGETAAAAIFAATLYSMVGSRNQLGNCRLGPIVTIEPILKFFGI